ncbi:MAG: Phosphoglycerate kinase [Candidatus Woesearchaeota archaeon]|nr:Phosphoglycerate kinase [Candidatus Woesearchaeota archaeon]
MMFQLKDFDFKDKRVLLRVDFNVSLQNGKITDDTRIKAALPTIKQILAQQPKYLIIMSHLGRPNGKCVEDLRLDPVAYGLAELLHKPVIKFDEVYSDRVDNGTNNAQPGSVFMLENVQFHEGEKKKSDEMAKKLASYADYFVFDAFGQSHRDYTSISLIQKYIPSCIGLLMDKELENLQKVVDPQKPFMAIIGGAKADKIHVIKQFMNKADKILFGGTLANTFLLASSKNIGMSRYDVRSRDLAGEILRQSDHNLVMPTDAVVAKKIKQDAQAQTRDLKDIQDDEMIVDIGPKTIELYKKELANAKTIFWAGPIGVFEIEQFANGTKQIAEYLSRLNITTVIGGGDSAAAVVKYGLQDKMTHVSTGGGASLAVISGKEIPALAALQESYEKFKQ